jgi:hypothetical protein
MRYAKEGCAMAVDAAWLKTSREQADADAKRLGSLIDEREKLDAEIRVLAEKVKSWQVILGSLNGASPKAPNKTPTPAEPTLLPIERDPENAGGGGFRATIREVLRDHPQGLMPRQVTDRLEALGFKPPKGATNLAVRVGAELWKMKETGQLRKARNGYALPKVESDV